MSVTVQNYSELRFSLFAVQGVRCERRSARVVRKAPCHESGNHKLQPFVCALTLNPDNGICVHNRVDEPIDIDEVSGSRHSLP